jgi:hypothetical protein
MLARHLQLEYPSAKPYIYRVLDRRVARKPHIPPGRTLHVIDIENLMGGPRLGRRRLHDASVSYKLIAHFEVGDHAIVAANPAIVLDVGLEWAGCRILSARGQHGADRALLECLRDAEDIASRFDRVIFGSGDGIFSKAVRDIRANGVAVGVIGRQNGISRELRGIADFVRFIPDTSHTLEAA